MPFFLNMTAEQKIRLKIVLKDVLPILGVLIIYYFFVKLTGFGIPCIFYKITGLQCPGCGISRMFMALFRFDFKAAAHYNLFILSLLPFGLALFTYKNVVFIKTGKREMRLFEKVFYVVAFLLSILFFIKRNFF